MFIVTFYSYKGGVGRTSALVNVADRLATRGKRVFVIDFDLEAPGIDAYGVFDGDKPRSGIVEYIGHFMNTGEVPKLENFVVRPSRPGLFFMPAGKKDSEYQTSLSQLNWKVLYRSKKGYLLVENLKAAIKNIFKPDYVLLDSRTGLTDVSGICTLQLPDLDVLIFSLNRQNVEGIARIYRSIKGNKLRRSISTLLVASPVPEMPESIGLRRERFECARKTIGAPVDAILPYDPYMAFQESVLEGSETQLAKSYDLLVDKVISANPTDVLTLLKEADELRDAGSFDLAELRYQEVVESRPKDPIAWVEFAKFVRARGNVKDACRYLENAHSLRPDDPEILAQLATTYLSVNRGKAVEYYSAFLKVATDSRSIVRITGVFSDSGEPEKALEGFTRMLQLEPKNRDAYISLAQTRMQLKHFPEAIDAYKRAAVLEPTDLVAVYNLGFALSRVGDPEAKEHFEVAVRLFEQIDPSSRTPLWMANAFEAISHAYLGIGRPDKAVQVLRRAIQIAERLGPERVFSSIEYQYVPVKRFISEAKQLLAVAERVASEDGASRESGRVPDDKKDLLM